MAARRRDPEQGFTLVELLTAIFILALVVIGVAYTLTASRGFVDRFSVARAAMARVEQRLEELQYPASAADTVPGAHVSTLAPPLAGNITGQERIYVSYVNDPTDDSPSDPNPNDFKQIRVTVTWTFGFPDSVSLTSYYAAKP
jgi:prepilin-type N-terminal cleavage/methylation domain-containing protein